MSIIYYRKDASHLYLPSNIEDAKQLGLVLSKYTNSHYWTVFGGLVVTYIFLQTFAIPGSIFLSILSGYLFSFPVAILLVCTCSAVGATLCYLLSGMFGHRLVQRLFPERLAALRLKIRSHRSNMLNYIIFLRITPILPNWLINISSPILGVNIVHFFVGTFLGVAPPSFLFIRAGTTLFQLTTIADQISLSSVIVLGLLALLSILPVVFKKYLTSKLSL